MAGPGRPESIVDFYTAVVLPALVERLDSAFPEFGWRRDARGWVATNEAMTHRALGVRAERVVAHGPAPRGFLVHGGEPMLWTAYLSGGVPPRGEDFVRVVRELADRAGVDSASLEPTVERDRRADLLEDFMALCRRELTSARGAAAREYLEQRGLPTEAIANCGLGLVPDLNRASQALSRSGYSVDEIDGAGIHADSRWQGRLTGAWTDKRGRIRTLWARAVSHDEPSGSKYLYLRGASRSDLPPYGWSELSTDASSSRRELLVVEGLLDVHHLRARGFTNVAALGGTALASSTLERLDRWGVEAVTLCFDRDGPGRQATARAIVAASRAARGPRVLVVDPESLEPAKDPDELVKTNGVQALRGALSSRRCGVSWYALELLEGVDVGSPPDDRRQALARAGSWLGTLPPRLALEQEDAVAAVADRCAYSVPAVQRAFRARFFPEPAPGRDRRPQSEELALGR